jgi:DNA adenine methylase
MHISNQINTLNYLGSKFTLLPWLLPKLKYTKSWVDLFGGSFIVTLNREPSPIETYNDINEDVVNFFLVLRDKPEELVTKLYLTPHSRWEYQNAWHVEGDSDIERARKFFVRVRQSFLATGSQQELKGWISATKESRCRISEATSKFLNGVDGLMDIVERLRRVQIECRDYKWLIKSYDTPDTMFYADPPYDPSGRSSSSDYKFDFGFEQHIELAAAASSVKGFIAVSGYDTDFMKELYKDFYYTEGPKPKNNYRTQRKVRECLFTNYDPYNCNNKHNLFSS